MNILIFKVLPIILGLYAASCSSIDDNSQVKAVFGDDNQVDAPVGKQYPYSAIGFLSPPGCTATLIGPRTVITAAHCMFDNQGELEADSFTFYLGYHSGDYVAKANVRRVLAGTRYTVENPIEDWAKLELDRDILINGSPAHTVPLVAVAGSEITRKLPVRFAGYPQNETVMQIQRNGCFIHPNRNSEFLAHDCDSAPGHSGAPLLVETSSGTAIVGIHVLGINGYRERFTIGDANLAVPITRLDPPSE